MTQVKEKVLLIGGSIVLIWQSVLEPLMSGVGEVKYAIAIGAVSAIVGALWHKAPEKKAE